MEIPVELADTFREFRTAEMTTISRSGEPVTWPVASQFDANTSRFLVTTSIGLPTKANNLRRNPRVGLFFSDPTGSDLDSPAAVMVQGLADVGELTTSIEGLEEYWKTIWKRQPASKLYGLPIVRHFADYYYMRVVMEIEPKRIVWWPDGDFDREPNEFQLDAPL